MIIDADCGDVAAAGDVIRESGESDDESADGNQKERNESMKGYVYTQTGLPLSTLISNIWKHI